MNCSFRGCRMAIGSDPVKDPASQVNGCGDMVPKKAVAGVNSTSSCTISGAFGVEGASAGDDSDDLVDSGEVTGVREGEITETSRFFVIRLMMPFSPQPSISRRS